MSGFVKFSNTIIASSDLALGRVGSGTRFTGEPIVDLAGIFRAANATLFGRGDGPVDFPISVWRFFDSESAALLFCGTHREELPVQADLTIVSEDATVALVMEDAVRSVNIAQRVGTAVLVEYKFTGGRFTSEDVPDPETEDEDGNDIMKIGEEDLAQDDESFDIVFDTPFGAVPRSIHVIIEAPGSSPCVAIVGIRSRSTDGFTAVFAAGIPDSGYKLLWEASLFPV